MERESTPFSLPTSPPLFLMASSSRRLPPSSFSSSALSLRQVVVIQVHIGFFRHLFWILRGLRPAHRGVGTTRFASLCVN
jgi:hypothetical protein